MSKQDYSLLFAKDSVYAIEAALACSGYNPRHFEYETDNFGCAYNIKLLEDYSNIYSSKQKRLKLYDRLKEVFENWFIPNGCNHIFSYTDKALVNAIQINDEFLKQLELAFINQVKYHPDLIPQYPAIVDKIGKDKFLPKVSLVELADEMRYEKSKGFAGCFANEP